ncbi:MAG: RNA polymerase sigma factor RpoD/SigA [Treponema sp.]|nr:RNA polymerase sigma factor RpoD/SigA [Candidatus Treponema equifaecale]
MKYDDETIAIYLKDINRFPLLTPEEEKELAVKAAEGSVSAKNKLVNSNLRFVITIAKSYQNRGIELADLISEGNIGLMTAVDHFDVTKGYKFISYAVWWIRQSIQKALCDKSRSIRLPMNKVGELVQIEKARTLVDSDKAEEQQIKEIAEILGMNRSYVRELLNFNKGTVSLDSPLDEVENGVCLGDMYSDDVNASPEEYAISEAMKEDLNAAVESLKPTAAKVLKMRYGLNGNKPMSLAEIGSECGLTKERIRQIELGAVKTLQLPSRKRRLESYVA